MAPLLALAPLILSGLKMASDADKDERNKILRSKEQRLSPWLTSAPTERFEADPAGTLAQGAAASFGMNQAIENQDLMRKLVDAQVKSGNSVNVNMHGFMGPERVRNYDLEEDPSQVGMDLGRKDYFNQELNRPLGGRRPSPWRY